MPLTMLCPNRHPVPFTDDDRGGEVYCPVCGVICPVPATDEPSPPAPPPPPPPPPPPAPRRRPSVFTAEGEERAAATTAGQTPCPRCGTAISYTAADYGEAVYCPRCGASATVGETLDRLPPPETEPIGTTPVRARSRWRFLRAVAALVLLAGVVAGGVYVSHHHPEVLPFDANVLPWNKSLIEGNAPGDAPPPAPKVDPKPPPKPDEHITPEAIDGLLRQDDVAAALSTARLWQATLAGLNVPETEPRAVRLGQVIAELEKKLARPAETKPTPADEFFKLLEAAAVAIKARDLDAARQALTAAEKLLDAHKELEQHRGVLQKYQQWLRQVEQGSPAAEKRAEDVEALLKKALTLATPEKVTEAMEVRAEALFLAPRVNISHDQKLRLEKAEKAATDAIQRARGRRAVADAERCLDEGDDEALRRLVAVAKKVLPEFTNDKECLAAYKRAEALAKEDAPQASGSAFGKAVLFRCDYEDALDAFRAGDVALGVETADRAAARASNEADRRRVADLVFRALDTAVLHVTLLKDGDPELPRRVKEAREGLAKAKRWRADPRWEKLEGELRKREG